MSSLRLDVRHHRSPPFHRSRSCHSVVALARPCDRRRAARVTPLRLSSAVVQRRAGSRDMSASTDRRAEPRSARRPQGRPVGRRRGRRGTCGSSRTRRRPRSSSAAPTPTSRSPALRDPGQLQRLSRSGTSRTRPRPTLKTAYSARRRRATCRSTRTCSSCRPRRRPARLDCGDAGRDGHGEQGPPPRHPHLRHHRHRAPEEHRATCRRAAARTRTRCSSIRRTRTTSTSTSRARPASARRSELPGCSSAIADKDPNSALFRIEVIKVPLAHPEQAAIVSSPRIFDDLDAAAGARRRAADDVAAKTAADASARGGFVVDVQARSIVLPPTVHRSRCSTAS